MEEQLNKKPGFQIMSPSSTSPAVNGVEQPLDFRETNNYQQTSSSTAASAPSSASSLLMTSYCATQSGVNQLSSSEPQARFPAAAAAASASHAVTEDEASAPPPQPRSVVAMERENFLVFIKILFKILDQANEPETKSRAQRIVLECRRRSQAGDPNFMPLMDATEKRLRAFVGEAKWRRAHLFLHHYIVNKPGNNHPPSLGAMRQRPTALIAGK